MTNNIAFTVGYFKTPFGSGQRVLYIDSEKDIKKSCKKEVKWMLSKVK